MKSVLVAVVVTLIAMGCGSDAEVKECLPEGSCSCTDGVERDTACVCVGGSDCSIDGDNIEFQCDGNASCGLTCGNDCLVICPGTTICTVEVGDDAVVNCPGTATCNIRCLEDCTVNVAGAADATVECVNEDNGAVCIVNR